jgi:predicted transcriptional regulator
MTINNNKLQQARKRTGLSLKHMAYLLQTDISNISKYERGIWPASKSIMFSYHVITGLPFKKLFRSRITTTIDNVSERITSLITELENKDTRTTKINRSIVCLHDILSSMTCLKDVSQEDKYE